MKQPRYNPDKVPNIGDKVLEETNTRTTVQTITKVTKTLIILKNQERYRRSDGEKQKSSGWYRYQIFNDDIDDKIIQMQCLAKIRALKTDLESLLAKPDSLSIAQLQTIEIGLQNILQKVGGGHA